MLPLELVKLTALTKRTSGSPKVKIGLIGGPSLPDILIFTSSVQLQMLQGLMKYQTRVNFRWCSK